ncbi:MAG: Hsp70 family protein, partial [Chthoniobacterales bacterium]|nr:Hsp70 family protein [Chthoniobacterales bacterium]
MSPTQPKFFIGIDLGTTNSALAYSPIPTENDPPPSVQVLPILQPATEDTQIVSTLLPSFLWLPPQSDTWTVGALARSRQPQMPNRSIRSSKSWLAHTSADRRANIFPLGSHDIPSHLRLSPVSAATLLLQHLAKEWERQNPPHKFSDQNITITVPASFDPTAQQLTLEAAHAANYPPTTALLEEPQAAFCFWLAHNQTQLHKLLSLKPNPHILVIDIGGGTSDFSIFQITQKIHSLPNLRRIAISNHLLLGGDNLDLALAHELESRLCPNNLLPPTSFALLLERAREIKELSLDIPTDSPTDNPTHTV